MVEKLEKILNSVKSRGKEVVGVATASYLLGLTTGAIGKGVGGDWQYAVPAAPLFLGFNVDISWTTPLYALGVATNYTEQIYEATKNLF